MLITFVKSLPWIFVSWFPEESFCLRYTFIHGDQGILPSPRKSGQHFEINHVNARTSWPRCSYGHHRCPRKSDRSERKSTAKLLELCQAIRDLVCKNLAFYRRLKKNIKINWKDQLIHGWVEETGQRTIKMCLNPFLPNWSTRKESCDCLLSLTKKKCGKVFSCIPLKSMFVQYYEVMLKCSFIKFLICKKCAHINGGELLTH